MKHDRPPEIKIELRSNPLYLSGAREMISAVAKRLGFSDEASGQIALALDEAICNIIKHGYERDLDQPIWISVWPVGENGNPSGDASDVEELRIVIEDEARQVDLDDIKSRDLENVRPGGLGVHIIRSVMDHVAFERRESRGMRLTMIKKRVREAEEAGSMKEHNS